jgi:hypothetical protein
MSHREAGGVGGCSSRSPNASLSPFSLISSASLRTLR